MSELQLHSDMLVRYRDPIGRVYEQRFESKNVYNKNEY